jgi:hypothetical protein
MEYPIELVVEMVIASFLDTEALGFVDCKLGRGQSALRRINPQPPTSIPR